MSHLRAVLPFYDPYRRGMVVGLFMVVVAQSFNLMNPYLIKLAIDSLETPEVTRSRIGMLAGVIVAAALIGGAARYAMREILNGISRRIEIDLRTAFLRHLLHMDATFFSQMRTGDLMSRATNDIQAVRQAAGPAVMYTVNTVVGFVIALSMMLWLSPRLTAIAMIPMVLLPPIVIGFGKIIHRRFEQIQEHFSTISTFVQENLTGIRIVRAYVQESEQEDAFDVLTDEYRRRNMHLVKASGLFHPLLGVITGLAMVAILWYGGLEVMAGRITVGDYVAFFFYLVFLIWPMIALGWVVNLYQRGAASMARLNRVLDARPTLVVPTDPAPTDGLEGDIEFRNVSFRYPGTERWVLEDVSFHAKAGQTVALVGPTGSGKSTIVHLLPRLYDPSNGEVLVDGIPIQQFEPGELRSVIGMVPQDPFLFSDTILDNIGLGLPRLPAGVGGGQPDGAEGDHPNQDVVEHAAEVAQLHESILGFPRGYNTILGERGINLSGGQKQRATLARAVARDPKILVLDDALSAVDTHTESMILTDLRDVLAGRTSFIISHRVTAVMNADQILVLDDGRIVERGTHAELIGMNGTYAHLLQRQLLEQELEEEIAQTAGD